MKTKRLPKKKSAEFESDEKAKKAGAKVPKQKRAKKPSIYDDDLDDLLFSDPDFGGFNDYDADDEDYY